MKKSTSILATSQVKLNIPFSLNANKKCRYVGILAALLLKGLRNLEFHCNYDRNENIMSAHHHFNVMANIKTTWYAGTVIKIYGCHYVNC